MIDRSEYYCPTCKSDSMREVELVTNLDAKKTMFKLGQVFTKVDALACNYCGSVRIKSLGDVGGKI